MGSGTSRPDWLFYDGDCGLCHGAVKFVVVRDRDGSRFRFAPLQGGVFEQHLGNIGPLPASIVVLTNSGRILVRSDATAYVLQRLGGPWALVGRFLLLAPRWLRDTAYDFVAGIRHRLFARPDASCPLLPPHLSNRFHS